MKYIFAVLALITATSAIADKHVNGYVRQDGTYVQPYSRTDSNNTKFDNYSTQGNVNPYTGKEGHVDPYKIEPYTPKSYDYNNPYGNK